MHVLIRLDEIAEHVEVILLGLAQRFLIDKGMDDCGGLVEIGLAAEGRRGKR